MNDLSDRVRGSATLQRLRGSHWARAVGVSVVVALVLTFVFRGLGYPIGTTFQRALIHSATITVLATLVLSRVMRRLRPVGPAVLWLVLIPILLGVALVGTGLSCGLQAVIGLGHRHGLWTCYTDSLTLNSLLTATIGIAMVLYESQRHRLDSLTLELRTRQLDQERANKMALEARLSTLESRLHPHFLFNTLNAISALVREDPDEAERTVERLAALLRFSLDATQRGLVPVADELKIVADYLEIERTRLGERLSYALKVSPEVTGWMIPPLLVQTLVENSVKHAIAPRSSGGHIRVDASAQGERLVVGVWDDGPGFSADSIVPGHGLDNLKGRLAARFGAAATFTVTPHDGGTLVTVAMPRAGHDLA